MIRYYYIFLIKPEAVLMKGYREYFHNLVLECGFNRIYWIEKCLEEEHVDTLYPDEIMKYGENRRDGYQFQLKRGPSEILVADGIFSQFPSEEEIYNKVIGDLRNGGFRGGFIKPNRNVEFWKSLDIGLKTIPKEGTGWDRLFNGCHGARDRSELIHNINWVCKNNLCPFDNCSECRLITFRDSL